jgi:putative transposase
VARWFPSKLYHAVPPWVDAGAISIFASHSIEGLNNHRLTSSAVAESLIESAKFYDRLQRWDITVFLLMPDHIHALLSFHRDTSMSRVIGDWKRFQRHQHGIVWQEGYFDHRLRDDERGEQLVEKMNYIRQNPIAAGLCAKVEEWPWWIERSALDE